MSERIYCCMFFILLLDVLTINITTGRPAVGQTVIQFFPREIVLGSLGLENVVNTTFSIAVVVENVEDLRGLDIQLRWNTTYLEYVNHTVTIPIEDYPEPIFPSPYTGILHHPYLEAANFVNEEGIDISGVTPGAMAWWEYSQMAPSPSFNGNGTVVIIKFRVKDQPYIDELPQGVDHVNLTLHFVSTSLGNSEGAPIPHTSIDANIKLYARLPSPDINNDGIVDIYDIVIVANAYGSHIGDPDWNPHMDLAQPYGVVDIFDIVTIASHYGEMYP